MCYAVATRNVVETRGLAEVTARPLIRVVTVQSLFIRVPAVAIVPSHERSCGRQIENSWNTD